MKRLTDERVMSELKNFKTYQMEDDKKRLIAGELAQLKQKKIPFHFLKFYKPVLSVFVLLIFLLSASFFVMNQTTEAPAGTNTRIQSGIEQFMNGDETFSIKESKDFSLKENENGSVLFKTDGKTVGGIEPLNEDEMVKSMNKQHIFTSEKLDSYNYQTTFTVDHQKTMEVTQILHYYFTSPNSQLNYHVYFHTPFFNEETADDLARSFKIYKDGKWIEGTEHWSLSTEFATPTFAVLLGEKDKLGISGPDFNAGKTDKYIWHFFGSSNEVETLSNGDFKVTATNKETGEKEKVLVQSAGTNQERLVWSYDMPKDSPLTGDAEVGSIHSVPSNLKFSKPGIWRLDAYFGTKRFGYVVVDVK
ncbi:hypothetical protein AWM68_02325 [Fictibacillus phosphorivorans]|uniref:Uncharacterized protein n=1 Tax=Fictibacillus phosphorivorans TaxID=1221500 RepID=A0A165P667_9BACL|nr:hypothetical protein [Fictibacillus phosphorivorans]KZE69123.1 hypothetical protein AWM68_02325 [Fictibacillus phosphorivorans]